MVPKVGDFVKINPNGMGDKEFPFYGVKEEEILEVVSVQKSSFRGDYFSIGMKGGSSFGILSPKGNFYLYPDNAQPLFLLASSTKPSFPEPHNNDGRVECFWCCIKTQKRGGGIYDVCPKCGK